MFGPILHFRGINADGSYRLAIQGLSESMPAITVGTQSLTARALTRLRTTTLWAAEFSVSSNEIGSKQSYTYQGENFSFSLPSTPENIHIAAVHGETDSENKSHWQDIATSHQQNPIHILIHTGNQIIAEKAFRHIPFLSQWRALPLTQRYKQPLPTLRQEEIRNFYFDMYAHALSDPLLAPLLSSIPNLFMWDDQDILSQWGDQTDRKLQKSPVYTGIFRVAREAFWHSAQAMAGAASEPLSWAYRIGNVGLIGLDLRSQRTESGLLGEVGWLWFDDALTNLKDCNELVIISPTPIALPQAGIISRTLALLVPTARNIMKQQWWAYQRKSEWVTLIDRLTTHANQSGAKITIISGGLQTALHSVIENGTARLHQIICADMSQEPNKKHEPIFALHTPQMAGQNRIRAAATTMPAQQKGWLELMLKNNTLPNIIWHGENAEPFALKID